MSWRFELTFDLFRIYLRDNSEKANISSIDAITRAFQADSGAIFYATSEGQFRFCLAGAAFPITPCSTRIVDPGIENSSIFIVSEQETLSDFKDI